MNIICEWVLKIVASINVVNNGLTNISKKYYIIVQKLFTCQVYLIVD